MTNKYIPMGGLHLRRTCDGMTVNYTAAQSEMMLPLLRGEDGDEEGGKEGGELARNRFFCLVGGRTDFVRSNGEGARSKPEIKKSFSTIDHGRRRWRWRRPRGGGEEGPRGMIAAREVSWQ